MYWQHLFIVVVVIFAILIPSPPRLIRNFTDAFTAAILPLVHHASEHAQHIALHVFLRFQTLTLYSIVLFAGGLLLVSSAVVLLFRARLHARIALGKARRSVARARRQGVLSLDALVHELKREFLQKRWYDWVYDLEEVDEERRHLYELDPIPYCPLDCGNQDCWLPHQWSGIPYCHTIYGREPCKRKNCKLPHLTPEEIAASDRAIDEYFSDEKEREYWKKHQTLV